MILLHNYSKLDFLAELESGPGSSQLASKLEVEVQRILHELIKREVEQIVENLNANGHRLRYYEEPIPGIVTFRDDTGDGVNYSCDLRLAVDTVISVGFRDTVDPLSLEESSHPPK